MECAHLFIRGEQQQHERKLEDQYDHIDKYLEMINEHNPTVLPALVEPKQLQSLKESIDGITSGGVSEAREVLRYLKKRFFFFFIFQKNSKIYFIFFSGTLADISIAFQLNPVQKSFLLRKSLPNSCTRIMRREGPTQNMIPVPKSKKQLF